jgi:hypothetical protein
MGSEPAGGSKASRKPTRNSDRTTNNNNPVPASARTFKGTAFCFKPLLFKNFLQK